MTIGAQLIIVCALAVGLGGEFVQLIYDAEIALAGASGYCKATLVLSLGSTVVVFAAMTWNPLSPIKCKPA